MERNTLSIAVGGWFGLRNNSAIRQYRDKAYISAAANA